MTNEKLKKIAQRRGLLNRVVEKINPVRTGYEALSPMYRTQMKQLRTIDDDLRKKLKSSNPKDDLKNAKKLFKNRKYLDALAEIKKFYDSLKIISQKTKPLEDFFTFKYDNKGEVTLYHKDPKSYKEPNSFESHQKLRSKASIDKEAGPVDWIRKKYKETENMRDDYVMEKLRKLEIRKKKVAINALLNLANEVFSEMQELFKELDKSRTSGKIDDYILAVKKFEPSLDQLKGLIENTYSARFENDYEESAKEDDLKDDIEEELTEPKEVEPEKTAPTVDMPAHESPIYEQETQESPVYEQEQATVPDLPFNIELDSENQSTQMSNWEEDRVQTYSGNDISYLITKAQLSLLKGDTGLAVAFLAKGSQVCDDLGAEKQSMQLYLMAQDLLESK